jgi:hypothetical protein
MSGLCDARRRVSCSFRQQAFAPRMRACRRDRALWERDPGRRRHAQRTRDDGLVCERSALVSHPHRPIHPFFDHDVGRPDIGPHLIELPVMGHRPVTAQAPCGLEAQAPVEIAARRTGSMQIGGPGWLNGEAPIVDRQIALQKLIGRVQRRDIGQPQLLD